MSKIDKNKNINVNDKESKYSKNGISEIYSESGYPIEIYANFVNMFASKITDNIGDDEANIIKETLNLLTPTDEGHKNIAINNAITEFTNEKTRQFIIYLNSIHSLNNNSKNNKTSKKSWFRRIFSKNKNKNTNKKGGGRNGKNKKNKKVQNIKTTKNSKKKNTRSYKKQKGGNRKQKTKKNSRK